MRSLETRILQFLILKKGIYMNPHGVTINLHNDFTVHAYVNCPDRKFNEGIFVEYFSSCSGLKAFLEIFRIGDFRALDKIEPCDILKQYLLGNGFLYCSLSGQELVFEKWKRKMKVLDNNYLIHEIGDILKEPEEYIDYTKNYYKLDITNA